MNPAKRKTTAKPKIRRAKFSNKSGRPCPVHSTEMKYHPDQLVWICNEPHCRYREYPELDIAGVPIMAKGVPNLVVTADDDGEKVYLLSFSNNVFVQVEREDLEFKGDVPEVQIKINEITKV